MKSAKIVIVFLAAVVAGGLALEAVGRVAGAQPAAVEPAEPAPVVSPPVVVAVPASPPATVAPTVVTREVLDGWVKVIGALIGLVTAIGAVVAGWATVTGNRRAEARDARAAALAELRAEQLRAVAARTGAPVLPTPPPTPTDPPA